MRAFVKALMDKYPQAGLDEIVRRGCKELHNDRELADVFFDYGITNTFNALDEHEATPERRPSSKQLKVREQERAARKEKREAIEDAALKEVRMRIALTCTMHELWEMGGAAQKLGKRGDRRLVATVYKNKEECLERAKIGWL